MFLRLRVEQSLRLRVSMGLRALIILRNTPIDHKASLVFPHRFSYMLSYMGSAGLEVALVVWP